MAVAAALPCEHSHNGCLNSLPDRQTPSPQPERPSSSENGLSTPPKMSASSSCRGDVVLLDDTSDDCDKKGRPQVCVPYAVIESVSRAIWSHAKAQAELTAGQGEEPAPESPTRKRRRTASDLRDEAQASCIFPLQGPSQPTQPSQSQEEPSAAMSEALAQAKTSLETALAEAGADARLAAKVFANMRGMVISAMSYWREVSQDLSKAATSLHRFLEYQRPLYWRHAPWRGVNLGGWLLLEPGPSSDLYAQYNCSGCEWQLMQEMQKSVGPEKVAGIMQTHRETCIVREDFRRIKDLGFNAVRIPFGYWAVKGPSEGDIFVGPCLEYVDRALVWCKEFGLQALLDLHGAPGGESGEKPCGRESKSWTWRDWRFDESVETLRILAERYRGNPVVTGISVCNEPAESVPAEPLCEFYDRAVRAIRGAGMPPDEVSIVLPVYRTERLDEIWRIWNRKYDGFAQHTNVAFDLHMYHCFGPWWQRQGLGSHMRMTKRHRKILKRVPAVVGEWSLALPRRARAEADNEDEAMTAFAAFQVEAYTQASHGWFFWNWRDCPRQQPGWDAQECFQRQWLKKAQVVGGQAN